MHFDSATKAHASVWQALDTVWSAMVPYHNEERVLERTIASLAAQSERPFLLLIDNASTDRSAEVARRACADHGIDALHLAETRPGKVAALQCGLGRVTTPYVATCDADTIYPADYFARASRILDRPDVVAGVAAYCHAHASPRTARLAGWRMALTARLLPQQCLNGGAGQVFRTAALKACGGFDPAIWNWVLEDHEIMARIERHGRIAYDPAFVCHPETRARAIDCTGWNLGEQLRYHATRSDRRVGYFHQFLAPRLHERALQSDALRRPAAGAANARSASVRATGA